MIQLTDVTIAYQQQIALENITLDFVDQTITGIIGPNGAGKSTLMKGILNIIPFHGTIKIDGKPAKEQLQQVAYVEQKSGIDFTFPITVAEFVSLGLYSKLGLFHSLKKKEWRKVFVALEQVGLKDFSKRQISELSGGQFQRILIARCLVQDARYIFLDEPFVGIDATSETIIFDILKNLQQEGRSIFVVHHDLTKVTDYFDHLLLLNKQLVAYGETSKVFSKDNLQKTFGGSLMTGGILV